MLSVKEISLRCHMPSDIRSLQNFDIDKTVWKEICYPVCPLEHNFYDEVSHHVRPLPKLNSEGGSFANFIVSKLEEI